MLLRFLTLQFLDKRGGRILQPSSLETHLCLSPRGLESIVFVAPFAQLFEGILDPVIDPGEKVFARYAFAAQPTDNVADRQL
ncbi:hypothetical protein ASG52_11675 [Methylobacterium sp. Leaf456]|nr:hypothetical protein ASG52_11675 [Methylobacterium sp. Leaf456]